MDLSVKDSPTDKVGGGQAELEEADYLVYLQLGSLVEVWVLLQLGFDDFDGMVHWDTGEKSRHVVGDKLSGWGHFKISYFLDEVFAVFDGMTVVAFKGV